MLERETRVNLMMIGLFEASVGDLRDEEWNLTPTAGGHAPLWIIGHLALVADNGCGLLGLASNAPESWKPAFGIGSPNEVANPEQFPKAALLDAFRANYQRLREAATRAEATVLDEPHGIKMFENAPVQTRGDVVALIMTSHLGFHLGQLSTWRRQHGRAPIF